jgi:hypothetical protein
MMSCEQFCLFVSALMSGARGQGRLVHFEQAVYGSFPFRNQGYALLAHSPGCRPEWLGEFRAACQRIGERPASAVESSSLFALRLQCRVWAIVGISPQGRDDRGRPGALGFHGLFLTDREYRKAGASPFVLAPVLRSDWTAETTTLAPGVWTVPQGVKDEALTDDRAARIALAIATGRRVVVESPTPIDDLARQVWSVLPPRVRTRRSVATWAFGNGNRFDLLAVPRLAGVLLDRTYDLGTEPVSTVSIP